MMGMSIQFRIKCIIICSFTLVVFFFDNFNFPNNAIYFIHQLLAKYHIYDFNLRLTIWYDSITKLYSIHVYTYVFSRSRCSRFSLLSLAHLNRWNGDKNHGTPSSNMPLSTEIIKRHLRPYWTDWWRQYG